MRARNERDLRARRGHYSLHDLVGLADIERLLAYDIGSERLSLNADDDAPAGDAVTSVAPRRSPGLFQSGQQSIGGNDASDR